MHTRMWIGAALLCLLGMGASAHAANTPCSGRKGGVDYCLDGQFVCRDGSISASRKLCAAPGTGTSQRLLPQTPPAASDNCSCRSGAVCTGPRGGRYCLSDSGHKSYLRR